jgi:CDP-diglyceride synthetase
MTAHRIASLFYLMSPIVLSGVCNMVYVKLPVHRGLRRPMDGGRSLRDGRRIFGDNKTWKGFIGMIAFSAFWFSAQAGLHAAFPRARDLSLVPFDDLPWPFLPPLAGALWGLGYVLFELPNSFMKRRLGIEPGTNLKGLRGLVFGVIDQADSVIGCLAALYAFYRYDAPTFLWLLLIGVGVHYVVNVGLFLAKLKRQAA